MDGSQFDSLARALHAGPSRRGVLVSVLGGVLGLLQFSGGTDAAKDSAKRCKGLKDRKKRKCLDWNKPDECRKDADCPDKIDSCQGGRCRNVCNKDVAKRKCRGCNFCVVNYGAAGSRSPVCGNAFFLDNTRSCSSPADCPNQNACIRQQSFLPCTEHPCGLCTESITPCA